MQRFTSRDRGGSERGGLEERQQSPVHLILKRRREAVRSRRIVDFFLTLLRRADFFAESFTGTI